MQTKITFLAILCNLFSFGQVGTIFNADGINYKITAATTVEVTQNPTTIAGAIVIPETVSYNSANYSVTVIGNNAFFLCSSLTTVTIPNSVTSIKQSAFTGCSSLTSVTIPNSVTSIEQDAFRACSSLTSVVIPNSITSISGGVFSSCTGLTSVTIPNSVTSIGDFAFHLCRGLTSVTIPNSVTSIRTDAFRGCSSLTSIFIPNSVTRIDSNAFSNCSGLTSVTIPNSVTSIEQSTFAGCSSLTSVTIPNSVTSIGNYAFSSCSKLTSVTVEWTTPLSITSNVFDSINLSIRTLNVPAGTATAYKSALVWKEFGTIVEKPFVGKKFAANSINYIVTKATLPYEVAVATDNQGSSGRFTNATQTGISGAVIIPDTVSDGGNTFSVTSISAFAFQNSTGLTSVAIPSYVLSIGDFAFSNCTGLTAVSINWTIPIAINANVFENITLTPITLNVPAGTETAYTSANVWKEFKVETTLGTKNFSLNDAVKFYPNPAQSQIKFSQEMNTLEVFDIAGKKVKTLQNPSTTYDVSTLQKGVYILKGNTTDGKSINEKLVKE